MALVTVATAMVLLVPIVVTGPVQAKVPGPNGQIVFLRHDSESDTNNIYLVNPDGDHLRQLSFPFDTDVPHWSPDGTKIAFNTGLNLCPPTCLGHTVIIDPDTGQYLILQPPDPTLFTSCTVWSPNAERFACEGGSDADPSRNGIYTIRTSDGGDLTQVTSIPGGDDVPIDYSPDGTKIVFGRNPNGPRGRNQALFVVNVDGSGLHRITPWGWSDDDGSWAPDGSRIVFEHFGSLFTVHPDGSGLSKIKLQTRSSTTAFTAFDAGWSPDGTKIVFSLSVQGPAGSVVEGIATANADGSAVQMITSSPTRDHKADWGPHPLAT
jgi:Tol biopolymer transport system component